MPSASICGERVCFKSTLTRAKLMCVSVYYSGFLTSICIHELCINILIDCQYTECLCGMFWRFIPHRPHKIWETINPQCHDYKLINVICIICTFTVHRNIPNHVKGRAPSTYFLLFLLIWIWSIRLTTIKLISFCFSLFEYEAYFGIEGT
jgi:hypothetical protein